MQQSLLTHLDVWTSALETRSTAGRGSNSKINLYGIKKLRELILELAVQGKLVPQDPNDEPASVLLEKIATEKNQLIKAGKLKKQEPLPPITDDEKPFELPNGWEWVRLKDIGYDWGQKTPTSTFTYIDVGSINKELGLISEPTILQANEAPSRARKIIKKGTVIYSTIRPYLLNIAIIDKNIEPEPIASTAFAIVHPFKGISSSFLYRYLRSPSFISYVEHCQNGIAYPAINDKQFFSGVLPLPPEKEQQRIVAKVDELMALCDALEQEQTATIAAHQTLVEQLLAALTQGDGWQRIATHFDTLFTTENSIDQLKQTILQLAVMGKLVPQNPNDEPASVLLEKIAAEKAQLIKAGKLKKEKTLPPITDDEKPFELPNGWEWCRLGDLAIKSEAGWSPLCKNHPRIGNNWGILKVSAVTWDIFKPEENKELPDDLEPRSQYEVKAGDFLISRANTSDLVAKAVIVPELSPSHLIMSDKIIRFILQQNVSGLFIVLVNNCQLSRDYYAKVAGGTSSSMKNVSRDQVKLLPIALPPEKEQQRIVAKVDELMTLCDALKAEIRAAQTTQLHLADALTESF